MVANMVDMKKNTVTSATAETLVRLRETTRQSPRLIKP